MLKEIRQLLEIQQLDQELVELSQQLAQYPRIWDEVKRKLASLKSQLAAAEEARAAYVKERKRLEQKIRLYSDDLRKSQALQASIKTTKEFEAANKQMEAIRAKLAQSEELGISMLGKEEEINAAVSAAQAELKKFEEFAMKEKGRIRDAHNEKTARTKALEKEKGKFQVDISADVMETYERTNRRFPGSAIVPVRNKSCGGCHFGLLPNVLVQLHRAEGIVHCPNCRRIFSEDETHQPAEVM